jgi:galactonate dehydratase
MKITQLHAVRVRIPQRPPIAPYQSRYRATSAKECLLVRLETDDGLVGWGETPEDWLAKSFEGTPEERLRQEVIGRDPFDVEGWLAENKLGSTHLVSGVEMALWDLMGKATRQPLYRLL